MCHVFQRSTGEAVGILGCRHLVVEAAIASNTVKCWLSFASRLLNWWEKRPSRASTITSGLATNPVVPVSTHSLCRDLYVCVDCFPVFFLQCHYGLLGFFCLYSYPITQQLDLFPSCLVPLLLPVCSFMFLQLHVAIRDCIVPKLPRGVWEQPELCVVDYLGAGKPHSSPLHWLWTGATVRLVGDQRWR